VEEEKSCLVLEIVAKKSGLTHLGSCKHDMRVSVHHTPDSGALVKAASCKCISALC